MKFAHTQNIKKTVIRLMKNKTKHEYFQIYSSELEHRKNKSLRPKQQITKTNCIIFYSVNLSTKLE